MTGTPRPEKKSVSTKLERIAEVARRHRSEALETLAHHIDIEWLHEAYRRTRKDGAVGIDGQTGEEYAKNLEGNLQSLLNRAKTGETYRAPPVKRVHIPKGNGKTRPIGIPTFEDKVLQRAVTMVLTAVYEQDFLDCSYGFRPVRSAHAAHEAVRRHLMKMGGGWVLEADIESFFDTMDRGKLREILRKRVRDGVLLRLIGKWLKAGVLEEGRVYRPEAGTPQGGVLSPLLANIYLHEVLDEWFESEVKPRLKGKAFLVRYCDDFVIVFGQEQDARRVLEVLPKRFGKYNLRLHPEKTRLVEMRPPPGNPKGGKGTGSLDFLGFTLFWSRSRKGNWVVMQKTASARLSRALRTVSQWLRTYRHLPVREQHRLLVPKLRGHDAYYGLPGNYRALASYRYWVARLWRKWLDRRSNSRRLSWDKMLRLLEVYPLPRPRIVHSGNQRA